ncbi:heterokaryon incompatibility protein [Fusarium bulbicola]|nr:heterokaryon incompatibility protein [Fusarium bulbicola]
MATSDYASESRGAVAIAVMATLSSFSLIVVSLRVYARAIMLRNFGVDDACAILACLLTIADATIIATNVRNGLGSHITTLSGQQISNFLRMFYFSTVVYNLALAVIKTIFLLQYYRAIPVRQYKKTYIASVVLVTCWSLSQIFLNTFMCTPIASFWDVTIKGTCILNKSSFYVGAAGNILTDILIMVLPIPVLRSLKLGRRQKWILISVFCLGIFTCLISLVRIKFLNIGTDITWHNVESASCHSTMVSCKLETLNLLEAKTDYESLSYAWGSSENKATIRVNETTLQVTQNLEDALTYLRHDSRPRSLWIDAICINQSDVDERNSQVRLMGGIYSSASCVISWLGLEDDSIDYVEQMRKARSLIELVRLCSTDELFALLLDSPSKEDLEEVFEDGLYSLQLVIGERKYRPPYWRRAWIIQEVSLARVWKLQSGALCISEGDIQAVMGILQDPRIKTVMKKNYQARRLRALISLNSFLSASVCRSILSSSETSELAISSPNWEISALRTPRTQGSWPLLSLLRHSWSRLCADPRDKVFAILAASDMKDDRSERLKIDYMRPISRVFTDSVKAIIENSSSLGVLSYVSATDRTGSSDLPSWVPNWETLSGASFRRTCSLGLLGHELDDSFRELLDELPLESLDNEDAPGSAVDGLIKRFGYRYRTMASALVKRSIFLVKPTNVGKTQLSYEIGIGEAAAVQESDLVCLLEGCGTPLILRPMGSQYVVSDILAVLFPLETNVARTFRLPENAPFHHLPSTPHTDRQNWDYGKDFDDYEHLKIYFQHPRRKYGFPDKVRQPDYKRPRWTIGGDPTATVYLGKDLLAEPESLELSIYREYTPYVVLPRSNSTASLGQPVVSVSFDDQNKSEHFCGSSILAFQPGSIAPWKNVTISIGSLSFRIAFPNHQKTPPGPAYLQNPFQSASWFPPAESDVGSRHPLLEPQRYHRGETLGQGGFGAVYRYIQYASGRTFAGKAIKPSKNDPNGQHTMERVKKEFAYMSRDSRFIVEVLGIVRDGFGPPVILMPMYPLGTLAGCTLTEKESVTAFRQILVVLMQLKDFDILHRDIKPGNILIRKRTTKTFQIVLADFGIAGKYTEQRDYFYGTPYYKAPEIFEETAEVVDDRSDVWSVGIIMLEKMYGLDKGKFPKPKRDSERVEWYARWQEEVRRKVEGIECESELGGLMKTMLQSAFVDCDFVRAGGGLG